MKKFAVVLCVFALVAGTAFAGGSQEIVDDGGASWISDCCN